MKPIIFTGDSFTFGEGLELHDDMYRGFIHKKCIELEKLRNDGLELEWDDLGYMWHKYQDFSENIIPAGKLRYELSYPALVSNHFNNLAFRKNHNGGNQLDALNFINNCVNKFGKESFSFAIINLTSPTRDECEILSDFFKNNFDLDTALNADIPGDSFLQNLSRLFLEWAYFKKDEKERFSNDVSLFNELRLKINKHNTEFISIQDADKVQEYFKDWDGWISGITSLYYIEYTKFLDNLEIPYYLLSPWNKMDMELLNEVHAQEVKDNIRDKFIPLYKNGNKTSLSEEWNTDFYLNHMYPWSANAHPSKYGHKIIADSIIKFIEENKLNQS